MNIQGKYLKSNIHKNISNTRICPTNEESTNKQTIILNYKENDFNKEKSQGFILSKEDIEIFNNISNRIILNSSIKPKLKKNASCENINDYIIKENLIFDRMNNKENNLDKYNKENLNFTPNKKINSHFSNNLTKKREDINVKELKSKENFDIIKFQNTNKSEISLDTSKYTTERMGLISEASIKPKKGDLSGNINILNKNTKIDYENNEDEENYISSDKDDHLPYFENEKISIVNRCIGIKPKSSLIENKSVLEIKDKIINMDEPKHNEYPNKNDGNNNTFEIKKLNQEKKSYNQSQIYQNKDFLKEFNLEIDNNEVEIQKSLVNHLMNTKSINFSKFI